MKKFLFLSVMVAGLAGFATQSHATLTCFPSLGQSMCGGMGGYCVDSTVGSGAVMVNGAIYPGSAVCVGLHRPVTANPPAGVGGTPVVWDALPGQFKQSLLNNTAQPAFNDVIQQKK